MLNSRSIPAELWVEAHKALLYFFRGRENVTDPEDLAQETLAAVWSREDYSFERKEDFLKVCYGFARNILQRGYRQKSKHAREELGDVVELPGQSMQGLKGAEVHLFLDEVRRIAEAELEAEEWELIKSSAGSKGSDAPATPAQRTRLHRARKKLARLTGWFQ